MTASSMPAMPTLYAGFTLSDWFASSGAPASSSACVWMRCWMMFWGCYRELSAYRQAPCRAHGRALSVRFDEIFGQRTGYASLDNLLRRLRANKDELLRVLEYPATPLNSNGAKTDIRAHVTRRKISFGTRSESRPTARRLQSRGPTLCMEKIAALAGRQAQQTASRLLGIPLLGTQPAGKRSPSIPCRIIPCPLQSVSEIVRYKRTCYWRKNLGNNTGH